jgi:hypothetical protein
LEEDGRNKNKFRGITSLFLFLLLLLVEELLQEEQAAFQKFQSTLKKEEDMWCLKSRSLWLQDGDRNRPFFHNQAKARLWKNKVLEINTSDGEVISSFEEIKTMTYKHFIELYSEVGHAWLGVHEQLLSHIPSLVSSDEKSDLICLVLEEEFF